MAEMQSRRTLATPVGHFSLPLLCNSRTIDGITYSFKRDRLLLCLEEKRNRPERHAIRNLLGSLAFRQGDRQGALDYFNYILSPGEDPGNLNALANRAFVTYEGEASSCKDLEPDESTEAGRKAQARRYAEQAFALINEKDNDAVTYERSRKTRDLCSLALELAGGLVDQEESDDWQYIIGDAYYGMFEKVRGTPETHDEAYEALEKAVEKFGTIVGSSSADAKMKSSAWVRIGLIFDYASKHKVQIGNVPENVAEFIHEPERYVHRALEVSPDSAKILYRLANFRSRAGDVREAMRLLCESIRIDDTKMNFNAFSSRATLCLKQYKRNFSDQSYLNQAKDDLEYILQVHETPWDFVMLADVYRHLAESTNNDEVMSKQYIKKALVYCFKSENCRRGNEKAELHKIRGQCYCFKGQHRRARESFKRGIECERKTDWGCGNSNLLDKCEYWHVQRDEPVKTPVSQEADSLP